MFEAAKLGELAIWYFAFLLSTTCHEYTHALIAFHGGDETAYHGGQLTLDPTPHIRREPFGMVAMPILSFFFMGWSVGWASVPFDPRWAARHPLRAALMSMGGPGANLTLALLAFVALRVLLGAEIFVAPPRAGFSQMVALPDGVSSASLWGAAAMFLSIMLNLNVLLGLFNLLPLPPLDGAGVVEGLAPPKVRAAFEKLVRTPVAMLIGLLLAWRLFGFVAPHAFDGVLGLLYPDLVYS